MKKYLVKGLKRLMLVTAAVAGLGVGLFLCEKDVRAADPPGNGKIEYESTSGVSNAALKYKITQSTSGNHIDLNTLEIQYDGTTIISKSLASGDYDKFSSTTDSVVIPKDKLLSYVLSNDDMATLVDKSEGGVLSVRFKYEQTPIADTNYYSAVIGSGLTQNDKHPVFSVSAEKDTDNKVGTITVSGNGIQADACQIKDGKAYGFHNFNALITASDIDNDYMIEGWTANSDYSFSNDGGNLTYETPPNRNSITVNLNKAKGSVTCTPVVCSKVDKITIKQGSDECEEDSEHYIPIMLPATVPSQVSYTATIISKVAAKPFNLSSYVTSWTEVQSTGNTSLVSNSGNTNTFSIRFNSGAAAGDTVTVSAKIDNGSGYGSHYTQDFKFKVYDQDSIVNVDVRPYIIYQGKNTYSLVAGKANVFTVSANNVLTNSAIPSNRMSWSFGTFTPAPTFEDGKLTITPGESATSDVKGTLTIKDTDNTTVLKTQEFTFTIRKPFIKEGEGKTTISVTGDKTVAIGATTTNPLTVSITPTGPNIASISWANPAGVKLNTVTENGSVNAFKRTVTGVTEGEHKITVTMYDFWGEPLSVEIPITVTKKDAPALGLSITGDSDISVGYKLSLTVAMNPPESGAGRTVDVGSSKTTVMSATNGLKMESTGTAMGSTTFTTGKGKVAGTTTLTAVMDDKTASPGFAVTVHNLPSAAYDEANRKLTVGIPVAVNYGKEYDYSGEPTGYRVTVYKGSTLLHDSKTKYEDVKTSSKFQSFEFPASTLEGAVKDNASKFSGDKDSITINVRYSTSGDGSSYSAEDDDDDDDDFVLNDKGKTLIKSFTVPVYKVTNGSAATYGLEGQSVTVGSATYTVSKDTGANVHNSSTSTTNSSTNPGANAGAGGAGSGYDAVPGTAESNAPIWLIFLMIFAVIGGGYALYMQLRPADADGDEE